jgi:uncharacterized protein YrrD
MKSIHDLLAMPLVTVGEGIRLGELKGVAVDTTDGRIRFLTFDGAEGRSDGALPWESVRSIGKDAITVDSLDSVTDSVPALERDRTSAYLGDRPVVTESGERLGTVVGYDIDESSGQIEAFHVSTGGFFGRLVRSERVFSRSNVRAIGQDAIVVADELQTQRSEHPSR